MGLGKISRDWRKFSASERLFAWFAGGLRRPFPVSAGYINSVDRVGLRDGSAARQLSRKCREYHYTQDKQNHPFAYGRCLRTACIICFVQHSSVGSDSVDEAWELAELVPDGMDDAVSIP